MPAYGTPQAGSNSNLGLNLSCLVSGQAYNLFNNETITAPQTSVAFSTMASPFGVMPSPTFHVSWATTPTATLQLQGSNVDLDANYVNVGPVLSTQGASYQDTGGYKYYRAKLLTQSAGGAVTVLVNS